MAFYQRQGTAGLVVEASGHPQRGIPAARLVKFGVQMEVLNLTKWTWPKQDASPLRPGHPVDGIW